jgi:hypothetical protein
LQVLLRGINGAAIRQRGREVHLLHAGGRRGRSVVRGRLLVLKRHAFGLCVPTEVGDIFLHYAKLVDFFGLVWLAPVMLGSRQHVNVGVSLRVG